MSSNKIKTTKYYDIILASFVAFLLISNISAVKLIELGPIITDGGALLFPLTYIFGDILTEVYGYRYARRAIWTAVGVMAIASLAFLAVGALPAASVWPNQESWQNILGFVPRIVIASLAAFLVGQFLNSYVLAKLKLKYGRSKMWVRLISSTFVGEFFDTLVFAIVAFAGTGFLSTPDMIKFISQGWLYKTAIEIIFLPITYRVINFLKKDEQLDSLDTKTNFTPFKLSTNK